MLCGKHAKQGRVKDSNIYVAINMHWEMHGFELPKLHAGAAWHIAVNTDVRPPEDIWEVGKEKRLQDQSEMLIGPRSVVVLLSKENEST
jgi:glycogen operon protein